METKFEIGLHILRVFYAEQFARAFGILLEILRKRRKDIAGSLQAKAGVPSATQSRSFLLVEDKRIVERHDKVVAITILQISILDILAKLVTDSTEVNYIKLDRAESVLDIFRAMYKV